jgi:pSer/pThr/pTyr-binding forkhead associated (FHA) protein
MRGSPEIVVILAVLALAALVGFFFVIRASRARSRMAVNVVEPALPDRVMSAGPSRVMIDPEPARKRAPQQPADSGMMARPRALAQLVMREPTTPPYTASISQPRFTLGRAPDNNGALPVDSGSGVSGHHAIVLQEQGEWYVQDAQSTNGTFINGRKLAKGSRERLQNGAVIGLGPKVKVEFRVQP